MTLVGVAQGYRPYPGNGGWASGPARSQAVRDGAPAPQYPSPAPYYASAAQYPSPAPYYASPPAAASVPGQEPPALAALVIKLAGKVKAWLKQMKSKVRAALSSARGTAGQARPVAPPPVPAPMPAPAPAPVPVPAPVPAPAPAPVPPAAPVPAPALPVPPAPPAAPAALSSEELAIAQALGVPADRRTFDKVYEEMRALHDQNALGPGVQQPRYVSQLQEVLTDLGYPVPVTGQFDQATTSAVL